MQSLEELYDMKIVMQDVLEELDGSFLVKKKQLVEVLANLYPDQNSNDLLKELEKYKHGWGSYDLSRQFDSEGNVLVNKFIPEEDSLYIPVDYHKDVTKILESGFFYPTLITGPSGVAKTLTVSQICAKLKRELIRVNITVESDEDSLMGGFRLENGSTVYKKGPIIEAMERGAILLLDEIDLSHPQRAMCLQSVLEGNGYLIKKTNEWVKPAKGFMIIATANTKGNGDEDGKYIGTQILNEAMLDRFPATFEARYPTEKQEKKILNKLMTFLGLEDPEKDAHVVDLLVRFANEVRDAVKKGQDDIHHNISTRRLTNILRSYKIFGDLDKAMNISLSRYDQAHKEAFLKIFENIKPKAPGEEEPEETEEIDEEFQELNPW